MNTFDQLVDFALSWRRHNGHEVWRQAAEKDVLLAVVYPDSDRCAIPIGLHGPLRMQACVLGVNVTL